MFRYKRGVDVSYERQAYIYGICRMYKKLPEEKKREIRRLCKTAGGENWKAVFELVTTDKGNVACSRKFYLSESTMRRCVKRFYESFPELL